MIDSCPIDPVLQNFTQQIEADSQGPEQEPAIQVDPQHDQSRKNPPAGPVGCRVRGCGGARQRPLFAEKPRPFQEPNGNPQKVIGKQDGLKKQPGAKNDHCQSNAQRRNPETLPNLVTRQEHQGRQAGDQQRLQHNEEFAVGLDEVAEIENVIR